MSGWASLALDDAAFEGLGGTWLPLRRRLGVSAFGTNVWRADAGRDVIPEHDEERLGHEELYVVLAGRATFVVGGDEVDAPAGTAIVVRDPALKRRGRAEEDGTTVLTVGAKPGEAFRPSAWEENADVMAFFERGDYAGARARLEALVAADPDPAYGGFHYNLACAEARLGETDAALAHLGEALRRTPDLRAAAAEDPDFEALRDEPRFAELLAE